MIPEITWTVESPADFGKTGPGVQNSLSATTAASRELELRAEFLREQWSVCGPGQLARIVNWLGLKTLEPVTVQLVMPSGDSSGSCETSNLCCCPARLHDVDPRVSEVVRVTWVIAMALIRQAIRGLPTPLDSRGNLQAIIESTGLVAALAAAESFGLVVKGGNNECLVRLAISLWGLNLKPDLEKWAIVRFSNWIDCEGCLVDDLIRK